MKIVIIGGGIIGLSCAWRLARGGAEVTVLERNDHVAAESTWAAAGMLAPLAEIVETPGVFFKFGLESLKLYAQFLSDMIEDGGNPPSISANGVLRIAFDRPTLTKLETQFHTACESGLSARMVTPEQLFELEPSVSRSNLVLGALLSEDERHIDPRALVESLRLASSNRGAKIVTDSEVLAIDHRESLSVATATHLYDADKVVIANGAWAAKLAKDLGVHLPTYPRKGQVIALQPPNGLNLKHTVYSHQTYVVPRGDRLLVGATQQDIGFDRNVTDEAIQRLKLGADSLIPGLKDAEVLDAWIGFRPATADNLPIIGPLEADPRIYFALGHQRNGILLSPITSISVCDEVLYSKSIQSLSNFRPDRFVADDKPNNIRPVVLVIAGSDPSGGAGIQADQRVIEALGCEAVCIATALTSQNSHGVAAVFPVPIDALRSQLETLLSDIRPDAVKIGLLPSAAHVEFIADLIAAYNLPNVVLDPVIAPSYGQSFLFEVGIEALRSKLLPLVDLVTPNIQEATEITGMRISTKADMEAAGRFLITNFGSKFALIKGGHIDGMHADDVLIQFSDDNVLWISKDWVDTKHTHGTGCALSSMIAVGLARKSLMNVSVIHAKGRLTSMLSSPRIVGSGHGSPGRHFSSMKEAENQRMELIGKLSGIYYVTDDRMPLDRILDSVKAALRGGVKVIQFRHKTANSRDFITTARTICAACDLVGAVLIVNDRVDVAKAVKAQGVHLGPDDIDPVDAARQFGSLGLIGISAGSLTELEAYEDLSFVSYIGCGPIFGTKTKSDAGSAIGLEPLRKLSAFCPEKPIIAIGGITLENLPEVAKTGIAGAAVVSAISQAPDPEKAARDLVACWNQYSPNVHS